MGTLFQEIYLKLIGHIIEAYDWLTIYTYLQFFPL